MKVGVESLKGKIQGGGKYKRTGNETKKSGRGKEGRRERGKEPGLRGWGGCWWGVGREDRLCSGKGWEIEG